jgi:hypothetical protein
MKNKIVVVIVFFIAGYVVAKSTTPTKVITKEKIKKVIEFKEKIIEVESSKNNRSENINEVIVISKDGTKTIKREIIKINKDQISKNLTKISNNKEKSETKRSEVIINKSMNLSAFVIGNSISDLSNPEYGVMFQKNVILDFNAGFGFTTKKTFLISVGYNF